MSKQKYILRDFIAVVPSCVQTASVAAVLETFNCNQSDRLVVLDERQYPLGVLHLRRFISQLMPLSQTGSCLNIAVEQPLAIATELVEPIGMLLADLSVEQFRYLQSQQQQIIDCELVLIDVDGKYLGLLESKRLWKFLALTNTVTNINPLQSVDVPRDPIEAYKLDLLVQLLEKLPYPLMLQTSTGEAIAQNPAWQKQLNLLTAPEAVRREVEATLKNTFAAPEAGEAVRSPELQQIPLESKWQELEPKKSVSTALAVELQHSHKEAEETEFNHCKLGNQPGSCICVWPSENGQDRVWQFLKIELWMSATSDRSQSKQIWLLMASDVTEQQQMASELAAKNADLIQLNRLKDEFLACISHELRTPLTAMLGLSTLLKDQTLGQLNERQARYARLIHENGRHLMSVVNDILDLTRMETGQMELTLEPVQIGKVCDRAIEQAKATIAPKNPQQPTREEVENNSSEHRFTLAIEPGLETMVADELRLRQMLVHLLANAFKFTELSGEIGLRVSSWAGWIAFTIWDTGIGIPEHQQHLIFQKFQQLENPLIRQFEGTGLGLVLTRALARLHGGDVSFLSQEGKGSQFTLLLPPNPPWKRAGEAGEQRGQGELGAPTLAKRGEAQWGLGAKGTRGQGQKENLSVIPHSPPHLVPPSSTRHLVLIVEAAPKFIDELAEQLTSLGYWVAIARSGTEALEKARRLQPGTIFLNPLLPLLSGWDVLTLLKSDAATSEIPVIVTTTCAQKAQALSSRADEFLSLPVTQQVLQQVMTRFCGLPAIAQTDRSPTRRLSQHSNLTILRLATSNPSTLTLHPSSLECRVLEADDLEQAALLARIWQPNAILLQGKIHEPLTFLQKLVKYSSLTKLPIVTLDAATTDAANQVGLSVFPCLTADPEPTLEKLLSVLHIAANEIWEYSVLVVDVAPLVDLSQERVEGLEKYSSILDGLRTPSYAHSSDTLKSEWLQALMQYLHTAGFRGVMAHAWEEVQQQIQKQNVDLILICLGESKQALSVLTALTHLGQQHKLPPVVVMERGFSHSEVKEQSPHYLEVRQDTDAISYSSRGGFGEDSFAQTDNLVKSISTAPSEKLEFLEMVLGAIATKILPSSLSMEELLDNIHQTLLASPARR